MKDKAQVFNLNKQAIDSTADQPDGMIFGDFSGFLGKMDELTMREQRLLINDIMAPNMRTELILKLFSRNKSLIIERDNAIRSDSQSQARQARGVRQEIEGKFVSREEYAKLEARLIESRQEQAKLYERLEKFLDENGEDQEFTDVDCEQISIWLGKIEKQVGKIRRHIEGEE